MDLTIISNTYLLLLAGGMGSRYKGQKQVDTLNSNDETLMEFALYDAIKLGIRKFVFIINEDFPLEYRKKLTNLLKSKEAESHFVLQTIDKYIPKDFLYKLETRSKPLGTAHAVYCAKDVVKGPFITLNADDYYGSSTFVKALEVIQKGTINKSSYAMCAFELGKTLSLNGSVSRGVCELSGAKLSRVEEYTYIERVDAVIKGLNQELKAKTLSPSDLVSMNFWILHPSFFDLVTKDLEVFLQNYDPKSTAEFYLPSVIDKAIQENKIKVEVLASSEKWFGLTYPSDKEVVVEELEAKKSQGVYPNNLWN